MLRVIPRSVFDTKRSLIAIVDAIYAPSDTLKAKFWSFVEECRADTNIRAASNEKVVSSYIQALLGVVMNPGLVFTGVLATLTSELVARAEAHPEWIVEEPVVTAESTRYRDGASALAI